ncbi:hypothetical protein ABKV19_012777 [Rosa sericea]
MQTKKLSGPNRLFPLVPISKRPALNFSLTFNLFPLSFLSDPYINPRSTPTLSLSTASLSSLRNLALHRSVCIQIFEKV